MNEAQGLELLKKCIAEIQVRFLGPHAGVHGKMWTRTARVLAQPASDIEVSLFSAVGT